MDVKLSTHMRDMGMRVCMFNPLVHCAAKENIVSETVRPCCKEIEKPYLTTFRLDCGGQILVKMTNLRHYMWERIYAQKKRSFSDSNPYLMFLHNSYVFVI